MYNNFENLIDLNYGGCEFEGGTRHRSIDSIDEYYTQQGIICLDRAPEETLDYIATNYLSDQEWDENYQGMILFDKREYLIRVMEEKQALRQNNRMRLNPLRK